MVTSVAAGFSAGFVSSFFLSSSARTDAAEPNRDVLGVEQAHRSRSERAYDFWRRKLVRRFRG